MKDTSTTQDRLQRAKDALIYALNSAERELPKTLIKQLETLVGKTEALQHKIK